MTEFFSSDVYINTVCAATTTALTRITSVWSVCDFVIKVRAHLLLLLPHQCLLFHQLQSTVTRPFLPHPAGNQPLKHCTPTASTNIKVKLRPLSQALWLNVQFFISVTCFVVCVGIPYISLHPFLSYTSCSSEPCLGSSSAGVHWNAALHWWGIQALYTFLHSVYSQHVLCKWSL